MGKLDETHELSFRQLLVGINPVLGHLTKAFIYSRDHQLPNNDIEISYYESLVLAYACSLLALKT